MFDPYVFNCLDGTIYIARDSFLEDKKKEVQRKTALVGGWSDAMTIRISAVELRLLPPLGNA